MERRLSVRGIVFMDGKLLCAKLSGYATGKANDYWCLPGGGLDDGEDLVSCLKREFMEETGVEPKVGNLLYIQQFSSGSKDLMDFIFHIENANDYLDIKLDKTSHGQLEIDELDFVDPKAVFLLPKFLSEVDISSDIQLGKTTVFNNY